LERNRHFAAEVEQRLHQKDLTKASTVLVVCRSGGRSAKAADTLTDAGFTQVYSVVDGFEGDKAKAGPYKGKQVVNGWKNSDLPWSYQLEKEKMYFTGKW
jgi:rhodanese-related sulfurtransferase